MLGTLAALAVSRYRFFGRETISFLIILPIALPGIVTGMALNATFTQVLGSRPVAVHRDRRPRHVLHRRRLQQRGRAAAAGRDVARGGVDGPRRELLVTFRLVTFPTLRTALVAGALLAFALSLDEIIVTTFTIGQDQTLPIWIFANYARPNQLPIVNVVGVLVILLSIIPVYFANRLSQDPMGAPAAAGAAGARA